MPNIIKIIYPSWAVPDKKNFILPPQSICKVLIS